jgi:hypothetical protein
MRNARGGAAVRVTREIAIQIAAIRQVAPEATQLDLPAEVLDKYLFRNADRFFFGNET